MNNIYKKNIERKCEKVYFKKRNIYKNVLQKYM